MKIVTFTTDFGERDSYVAEMKGSLLSRLEQLDPHGAPPALVDVTHQVPRHDVGRGAALVARLAATFPVGTIHLVVIDPGVGSSRRPLAAEAGSQFYVGPDNGVLTPVLDAAQVVVIDECWRQGKRDTSGVFDGRDLFAPVAAALLTGASLVSLGSFARNPPPERLSQPPPCYNETGILGVVTEIDVFGNARTNIDAARVPPNAQVTVASSEPALRFLRAYADVAIGHPLAVTSSDGSLEIAVREGTAAEMFSLQLGTVVEVNW